MPLRITLKNGTVLELDWMRLQGQDKVRTLLNIVIIEGRTYPQDQPLSEVEFAA